MTDEQFEEYRPLLFSIAYRMLGSAMDAEDIVQEAWLRYRQTDREEITSPKAYLSTIVTRLCINQLKSARERRESYIGPWLPEPILTGSASGQALTEGTALTITPAQHLSRFDSISMAFLVLLEQLTPAERAVFLLREVFDYDYAEIAAALDKSEAACRQLFSRARKHMAANRPRFESSAGDQERLVKGFLQAVEVGDVEALTGMLAEDVVVWTDGGGKVFAAPEPVYGPEKAARFILGARRFAPGPFSVEMAAVNGKPGILLRLESGRVFLVIDMEVEGDQVRAFHIIGNPDKLRHL
ncbi:MAG: RNA polymerase sigma-70 factor [Chloroflexota bacterium]|nr:MAG: RNA polymerase sigma-70 factor [Chloroflexota bacterium]